MELSFNCVSTLTLLFKIVPMRKKWWTLSIHPVSIFTDFFLLIDIKCIYGEFNDNAKFMIGYCFIGEII